MDSGSDYLSARVMDSGSDYPSARVMDSGSDYPSATVMDSGSDCLSAMDSAREVGRTWGCYSSSADRWE
jgi:hypothetical protein